MLRVKDIMIQNVYTVNKDDNVQTVLEKFAKFRISGMPIVDDNYHLVGYISDGDIMRFLGKHVDKSFSSWISLYAYYYAIDPKRLDDETPTGEEKDEFKRNSLHVFKKNVLDVGVKKTVTVKEEDSLVHVANVLAKRNIKKVPVVRDQLLVGIISRGDVVRSVVKNFVTMEEK
ncbi:CBS domain-containing protein [Fictibacillus gelatini]|uniref:CBS domain-containing protein n=1 Tax=Fictibacillus gelatini TaxID=225985 RepID=UPI0003F98C24|nr:CBS domain-containing protein [Fictibacillus gelatini]